MITSGWLPYPTLCGNLGDERRKSHRGANMGPVSTGLGFLGKVQVYWTKTELQMNGVGRRKRSWSAGKFSSGLTEFWSWLQGFQGLHPRARVSIFRGAVLASHLLLHFLLLSLPVVLWALMKPLQAVWMSGFKHGRGYSENPVISCSHAYICSGN